MKEQVREQVRWILNMKYEDIPSEVTERARWVLLDSIGCILNGLEKKLPADSTYAILQCSGAMLSTELYEGNRFAVGHPACHIVPILLEEIRGRDISYKEMIRIFICAYEVASRWGDAIRFSSDMLGHGTIMNAGAAVVMGMLEDLDEETFTDYLMTSEALPEVSTWESVFQGSMLHDFYPGIAAVNAKNALFMTLCGCKGSEKLIRSIYKKIEGTTITEEKFSDQLGSRWFLTRNYFKVYSGCRFIHPFADVIKQFLLDGKLKKDEIDRIEIYTYKKAARISQQTVNNVLAAKFSTPVALAVLISTGELYPEDIEKGIQDSEVKELAARIFLEEAEKYNELLPDIRGGLVRVIKKNGKIMEQEVFHAYGDFDNPHGYTEKDLINKFRCVTGKKVDSIIQDKIIQKILQGEEQCSARKIFSEFYDIS